MSLSILSDMIEEHTGNLLEAPVEALTNAVNTVGIAGKGIASQFKERYPENFEAYQAACKTGEVEVGRMFITEVPQGGTVDIGPRYVINFPTKKHWRGAAQLSYVEKGLYDLVEQIEQYKIASVAIPALGCGHGGLEWVVVRPMMAEAFRRLPNVKVLLFVPGAFEKTQDN